MRWTREQWKAYEARRSASVAKPQRALQDEPLGKAAGKEAHPRRREVRIVSFRCRLLDPDNLCPKYFIDALRHEGILQDDTPDHIDLRVSQVKVKTRAEERTEIEIL